LVASDEKYAALTTEIHWKKALWLLPGLFLPFYYALPLLAIGKGELRKWVRRGEIPIPHLTPREAEKRFRFDYNHLTDGAAYIAHPVLPNYYLVPALANERLAQEKFAAFLVLTAALGAKKLEIISAEFSNKKQSGKLNITDEAARVGIDWSKTEKGITGRHVIRSFEKPGKSPYVPKDIEGWLDEDPIFRAVAKGRLDARIITDEIKLHFENRVAIDSSVTLGLGKVGISAGGESREVASCVYGFDIEYWPIG
jgi:hypothetical protein